MLSCFMGGVDLTGVYRRCSFNCNPFIFVASFISTDAYRSLKQFIEEIFTWGGGGL